MKQILINVEPFEKRVAIIEKGVLEEFLVERTGHQRLAGNIYKGVIESVVPGIGALFVDIGAGKNGFLYIKDAEENSAQSLIGEEILVEKRLGRDLSARGPDALKKGQELYVQVVKEPIGTKGALLTTDISLPGKYLVFMPFNATVGISKRVEDRSQRAKLKDILGKLILPAGAGCIARTESADANQRQLRLEMRYLSNLWLRIKRRGENQKAPVCIYEEYDVPLRIVRDHSDEHIEKILVDSKEEYRKICRFVHSIQSSLRKKIFYYKASTPLFERYGIEERIEEIFRRKVSLKSGGSIVIEQTEGLVSIDVNTGKFTGKRNPEETSFKTNMEAAAEIARQVMLRDIGGIIVIDFIDMNEKSHRRDVHATLENAFKKDKARIKIFAVSPIGIVEMTRQRIRKTVESLSFKECPYCSGMGRVKTPATIAIETVRRLRRVLWEKRSREIILSLHPDVGEYLGKEFKDVLCDLERKFRKKITIRSDSKIHVEDIYFD